MIEIEMIYWLTYWIGTIFLVIGLIEIALHKRVGYPLVLVGNITLFMQSINLGIWNFIFVNSVCVCITIFGWWNWMKEGHGI